MKKLGRVLGLGLTFTWVVSLGNAWATGFDDVEIKNEGDSAFFIVGVDSRSGLLTYGVDRKTQICFLTHMTADFGKPPAAPGTFQVPCDKLKVYPTIKKYLETGKLP